MGFPRSSLIGTLAIILCVGVSFAEESVCSSSIAAIPILVGPKVAQKLGITLQELGQLKKFVPKHRVIRLVLRLSDRQYVLLHENYDSEESSDKLIEPDAHILIIRDGNLSSDFAMSSLADRSADSIEWMKSMHGVEYARTCGNTAQFIYLGFGTGQGGFFVAIAQSDAKTTILPLGSASQGHLLISASTPSLTELWSVLPRDGTLCTGCPKHYTVTTIDLSSGTRSVKAERATKRKYFFEEFEFHEMKFDSGIG